jgi:hypothetical protein
VVGGPSWQSHTTSGIAVPIAAACCGLFDDPACSAALLAPSRSPGNLHPAIDRNGFDDLPDDIERQIVYGLEAMHAFPKLILLPWSFAPAQRPRAAPPEVQR